MKTGKEKDRGEKEGIGRERRRKREMRKKGGREE